MNIDEYRALKEAESKDQTVTDSAQTSVATVEPVKIKIGEEEFDIEELKKGYMRQSDYTKKTQSLAETRKEQERALEAFELIKTDEDIMTKLGEKLSTRKRTAPESEEVIKLKAQLELMQLENEVTKLSAKYKDFDEVEVLTKAKEIGVTDLEFVYKALRKSETVNMDAIREQIKKELLQDASTTSTVGMASKAVQPASEGAKISAKEASIAEAFGMDIKDYTKFKR